MHAEGNARAGPTNLPVGPVTPRSHREWAALMWIRMDRDRNGWLSRDEFDCEELRTVIKSVVAPSCGTSTGGAIAPYARAEMNTEQAVSFCLRKADLNHDGRISFEEFESFTLALRRLAGVVPSNTADLIFALFDLDSNHMIDEQEFREIYRFFTGRRPTEEEFLAEWRRLDKKFNNAVTRDEYALWLRTSTHPSFKCHAPPANQAPLHRSSSSPGDITDLGGDRKQSEKDEAAKLRQMWKRGGCSHMGAQPLSRNGAGIVGRAKWNDSRWDPAIICPILPKSRTIPPQSGPWGVCNVKAGTPLYPPRSKRHYFSKHKSDPELLEYYKAHPSAMFDDLAAKLEQSGPISRPSKKRPDYPLSDPIGPNHKDLPMLHDRHVKGGNQRCSVTGTIKPWDNHWMPTHQLKDLYTNGTGSLRCPGTPPRHLYVDEYYDDGY